VAFLAYIPEGRISPGGKDYRLCGLFLSGREYDALRRWQVLLGRGNCNHNEEGRQEQQANE